MEPSNTRINGKVIRKETIQDITMEKSVLELLLREVKERERNLLKSRGEQTWLDWLMEQLGY
tara:strand:+ start:349 stop:534 length:186 start_codon:yes stop_codon:yes gene_type:complete